MTSKRKPCSEERKQKISEALRRFHANNPENRARVSEKLMNHEVSDITRDRMRVAALARAAEMSARRTTCNLCGFSVATAGIGAHLVACEKNSTTRKRGLYRRVFIDTNGNGPYDCYFCSLPVRIEELVIHHKDENYQNNAPENLGASHKPCHDSHSMSHTWEVNRDAMLVRKRKEGDK